MTETRRRAYLDAMGIDIWAIKPPAPLTDRLVFQPGTGSTLLICDTPDATATRFAADIKRAFPGEVVWAWPDPEGRAESPTLEQAVADGLFTRVVLFGPAVAGQLFKGDIPEVAGSASVTLTEALDDLADHGKAKRILWRRVRG